MKKIKRFFDNKLSTQEIKRLFGWQAVKKIPLNNQKLDHNIIKDTIKEYGDFLSKLTN
jgi:hypothetical protein